MAETLPPNGHQVRYELTEPDPIFHANDDKKHALRIETAPGSWQVVALTDHELVALFGTLVKRIDKCRLWETP